MSDRELFEQALKALETNIQAWKHLADSGDAGFWEAEEQPFYETSVKAITALRAALAEPVQEPVAWSFEARHIDTAFGPAVSIRHPGREHKYMRNVKPLYTAPPQRKPLLETSAERTLKRLGYTDCGGEFWKPPLGAPAEPVQEPQCNPHPKAPHGFLRNASHNADRYVCECDGWEPYEAGYQAGMEAALRAQS